MCSSKQNIGAHVSEMVVIQKRRDDGCIDRNAEIFHTKNGDKDKETQYNTVRSKLSVCSIRLLTVVHAH